jgi:hypothetical protein
MPTLKIDGVGRVKVDDSFLNLSEEDRQKTVDEIAFNYNKEKEAQSEDKQNLLFKTLDQLNRPQYAIANAIYQAYTNDDFKLGQSLWDGLSLKEKRSVGDTLREVIEPEGKFGKIAVGAAGFAGDILTDPLTYTGVGLVGKSGKLLKSGTEAKKMAKAARAVGKTDGSKRVLTASVPTGFRKSVFKPVKFEDKVIPGTGVVAEPIARGLGKIGKTIKEDLGPISDALNIAGQRLSTKFRPKDIDPIQWQKYVNATTKAKNIKANIELESIEKSRQIAKAFKDEGLDDESIAKITNQLETKQPITSPGGQIAKEFSEELSEKYAKVGPSGKQLIDDEQIGYVPHVLDKKAKKYQDATGFSKKEFTTSSPSDIARTLLKYTDDAGDEFVISTKTGKFYKDGLLKGKLKPKQLNELDEESLAQASISEINKAYGDIIFSTKLPNLVAIQGLRTAKVVGGDEFYKEVAKIGSRVQKPGMVESTAPELAGKFYDPALAAHIDKTFEALKPQELNNFVKNYDKIQNAWKMSATFWNPAFHSRNAISNMYQNTLAGVNDPADYARASRIQYKSRKSIDDLAQDDKKIMKEYREQGLDTTGHFSGDIEQSIEAQINTAFDMAKKGNVIGVINKAGGAAGNAVETNAKLAHYIAKRNEGLTPFEAGESVKKYLFDYQDLTRLEKDVFKRLMPFYTWTRKNIPLQIEALIKDPARQTKLIKFKNNVEVYSGDDKTNALLPEYMQNASPVFIGKKDGKVRYIKLEGFLPTADLNRLSEPAQEMLALFSPILKAPIEQTANYNFFFGQPLTRQKGIKGYVGYGERDYLFTRIPGRLEHLARLYRPLSEIDKVFGKKYKFQTGTQKAFNLLLGGKVYEYEVKDLLKKFDRLTQEEARMIKYNINRIKEEMRKHPEQAYKNEKDLKNNIELYRKSRMRAAEQRGAARQYLGGK